MALKYDEETSYVFANFYNDPDYVHQMNLRQVMYFNQHLCCLVSVREKNKKHMFDILMFISPAYHQYYRSIKIKPDNSTTGPNPSINNVLKTAIKLEQIEKIMIMTQGPH